MQEKNTDMDHFADNNEKICAFMQRMRVLWQKRANRRTEIIVIIGGIILLLLYLGAVRPPNDFPTNTLIEIKQGESLVNIAENLEMANVIRSGLAMRVIAKIYNVENNLHAGDYLFKEPLNMLEVLKRVSIGAFGLDPVKIQVREGSTVKDIANILEKQMLKFDKDTFINMANKYEGYLFPDTYYFLPNTSEDVIVSTMVDNFYTKFKEIEDKAKDTGLTLHELVTLASIVELEAWKYEDRRKIAGVLYNRLAIDMPLQVDVSFIYIMNKGSFEVTREDMRHPSLYNTYVHKGLPPGPIGSPSLASLKAVVNPAGRENNWLFYLADSTGVTHFSKTYQEHLAKKKRYIDNR